MSQTSVIAGGLLLAYFIFIVVRGELPCYLQVLGVATDAQCPSGNVSSTQTQICSGTTTTTSTGSTGSTGSGSPSGGIGSIGSLAPCPYGLCDDGTCADSDGYCDDQGL